jgi:hypothetical protein
MDSNRSQRELTIEISPLHFLVSNLRLEALAAASSQLACFSPTGVRPEKSKVPRLEILSGLMVLSIDLSLRGVHLSLLSSEAAADRPNRSKERGYQYKNTVMTESLTVFLQTVSRWVYQFSVLHCCSMKSTNT